MGYLILSIIIILVLITSFFVIKHYSNKVKHLEFKLEFAENQILNNEDLKIANKKIQELENEKHEFKKKVNNSSGSNLADIANSL